MTVENLNEPRSIDSLPVELLQLIFLNIIKDADVFNKVDVSAWFVFDHRQLVQDLINCRAVSKFWCKVLLHLIVDYLVRKVEASENQYKYRNIIFGNIFFDMFALSCFQLILSATAKQQYDSKFINKIVSAKDKVNFAYRKSCFFDREHLSSMWTLPETDKDLTQIGKKIKKKIELKLRELLPDADNKELKANNGQSRRRVVKTWDLPLATLKELVTKLKGFVETTYDISIDDSEIDQWMNGLNILKESGEDNRNNSITETICWKVNEKHVSFSLDFFYLPSNSNCLTDQEIQATCWQHILYACPPFVLVPLFSDNKEDSAVAQTFLMNPFLKKKRTMIYGLFADHHRGKCKIYSGHSYLLEKIFKSGSIEKIDKFVENFIFELLNFVSLFKYTPLFCSLTDSINSCSSYTDYERLRAYFYKNKAWGEWRLVPSTMGEYFWEQREEEIDEKNINIYAETLFSLAANGYFTTKNKLILLFQSRGKVLKYMETYYPERFIWVINKLLRDHLLKEAKRPILPGQLRLHQDEEAENNHQAEEENNHENEGIERGEDDDESSENERNERNEENEEIEENEESESEEEEHRQAEEENNHENEGIERGEDDDESNENEENEENEESEESESEEEKEEHPQHDANVKGHTVLIEENNGSRFSYQIDGFFILIAALNNIHFSLDSAQSWVVSQGIGENYFSLEREFFINNEVLCDYVYGIFNRNQPNFKRIRLLSALSEGYCHFSLFMGEDEPEKEEKEEKNNARYFSLKQMENIFRVFDLKKSYNHCFFSNVIRYAFEMLSSLRDGHYKVEWLKESLPFLSQLKTLENLRKVCSSESEYLEIIQRLKKSFNLSSYSSDQTTILEVFPLFTPLLALTGSDDNPTSMESAPCPESLPLINIWSIVSNTKEGEDNAKIGDDSKNDDADPDPDPDLFIPLLWREIYEKVTTKKRKHEEEPENQDRENRLLTEDDQLPGPPRAKKSRTAAGQNQPMDVDPEENRSENSLSNPNSFWNTCKYQSMVTQSSVFDPVNQQTGEPKSSPSLGKEN